MPVTVALFPVFHWKRYTLRMVDGWIPFTLVTPMPAILAASPLSAETAATPGIRARAGTTLCGISAPLSL